MPKPHDPSEEALRRLDKDLETFEAKRAAPATMFSAAGGINEGYRLLAGLLGGVFGGVGLGWLFDHFAHTAPLGLIGGLLIGLGTSIYASVSRAMRSSDEVTKATGIAPAVRDDPDDSDN